MRRPPCTSLPLSPRQDLLLQGLALGASLAAALACAAAAAWQGQAVATAMALVIAALDVVLVAAIRRQLSALTAPPTRLSGA